jgi:signal transduction histidine kinase
MTVQAGAARMTLGTDPDRALEALLAVEETGRQALDELRRLLCILRPDQPPPDQLRPDQIDTALVPQPGLDNLPELVESVRGTGLPVELVTDGVVRPVAPGLGLTVYRIVQEALTNTLKHAAAQQVRVLVNYGPHQLQVEVRDDGSRPSHTTAKPLGQGGHGLAGMRERAALYGGEVHVGPGEDGGYLVSAKLPIGQSAP